MKRKHDGKSPVWWPSFIRILAVFYFLKSDLYLSTWSPRSCISWPRAKGEIVLVLTHFFHMSFSKDFLGRKYVISIEISLEFVPIGPLNNFQALVQIMAWRRLGDKPLSEPMMVSLLTHICITRPQWVTANTNTAPTHVILRIAYHNSKIFECCVP